MRSIVASYVLAWPFAAALFALTACGGGSSDTPPIQVTLQPTTLSVVEVAGSFQRSIEVSATLSSTPSGTVYPVVLVDKPVLKAGPATVSEVAAGRYVAELDIDSQLAPGTYQGTMTLHLCKNAACTEEYALTGNTISYDFRVFPKLLLSATVSDGVAYPAASLVHISVRDGSVVTVNASAPVTWQESVFGLPGASYDVLSSSTTSLVLRFHTTNASSAVSVMATGSDVAGNFATALLEVP